MSGTKGTFFTRWTTETARRWPESGWVSDTCGSQCHSGNRTSVFHKQSKSRHLSQTEKNNQSLQLLWLPWSQAQGMECPPYILRKIQTVKNLLISWKDRQKKKWVGSHCYLWRDLHHYHPWWMEKDDPTEASMEWLLGPATGEQNITNKREPEFRDKLWIRVFCWGK